MTGAEIITVPAVTVTGTGLEIPDGISRGSWEEVGESLSRVDKALQMMVGDWINAGISEGYVDSESYDAAQRLFPHLSRKTLQEYAYVARASSIRMEELSFGHHQAVAALPAGDQQERLEEARYHEWPVSKLRARLAQDRGDQVAAGVADEGSEVPQPAPETVPCPGCGARSSPADFRNGLPVAEARERGLCNACGRPLPAAQATDRRLPGDVEDHVRNFLAIYEITDLDTGVREAFEEQLPDDLCVDGEIPKSFAFEPYTDAIELINGYIHQDIGWSEPGGMVLDALALITPLITDWESHGVGVAWAVAISEIRDRTQVLEKAMLGYVGGW